MKKLESNFKSCQELAIEIIGMMPEMPEDCTEHVQIFNFGDEWGVLLTTVVDIDGENSEVSCGNIYSSETQENQFRALNNWLEETKRAIERRKEFRNER